MTSNELSFRIVSSLICIQQRSCCGLFFELLHAYNVVVIYMEFGGGGGLGIGNQICMT